MSDRIWLNNYPEGVPAEIDGTQHRSLVEFFEKSCAKYADKVAFRNLGASLTYAELERRSRDVAAWLQSRPDMKPGDRVAIMMPNLLQYAIGLFGILRAGFVVVNVNPLYTSHELEHQLNDSGARAILVVENFAATLQAALGKTGVKHVVTTAIGDCLPIPRRWIVNAVIKHVKKMVPAWHIDGAVGFNTVLKAGAALPLKPVALTYDDIAFLQYTGGTTGVSKGAMLTHGNILSNLEQSGAWISSAFRAGEEVIILPLPMYHIFCLTSSMSFIKWGATSVLITNPRDLPALVKELAANQWSVFIGVNTLFNGLLNTPGFAELDFAPVKVIVGGGAAVQGAVAARWQAVTGHHITEAYGLTETSPGVCANPVGEAWNGSIGLPFPSTDVTIRGDDFNVLPIYDGTRPVEECTGEICVRGPQVMLGYWQRPDETAKVIEDGWLRTGDVGHMNERGYLTITDRKKDMILVSGFNVYPNEVEGVIALHPGVLECAVVGVPDDKSGESVMLVVVRKDPNLTEAQLRLHCKEHLTGYKQPRIIEFRTDLPKTPVGKVLRRQLRRQA